MTIKQAIDSVNAVRPSAYSSAQMVQWLSDLDKTVFGEVLSVYTGATELTSFDGYSDTTADSTTLLIPSPYDEAYLPYLLMKIDFFNADLARYNVQNAMFESLYQRFLDYVCRSFRYKAPNVMHVGY